jgi:hypothetical protein
MTIVELRIGDCRLPLWQPAIAVSAVRNPIRNPIRNPTIANPTIGNRQSAVGSWTLRIVGVFGAACAGSRTGVLVKRNGRFVQHPRNQRVARLPAARRERSGCCPSIATNGWRNEAPPVVRRPTMRIATFVSTVGLAVMGTIAFAQNVTYDFDRSANFSSFKTYAWVRGTNLSDELNHKRVMRAVDTQLSAHGLARSESPATADVLVAYHASFDKNLQINGFSSGFGGYRFGGNRSGTATVDEILIGTLAVDIVDAKTKTIVWRGLATKEVDTKASAEKRDKNINRAAEKLFKNYPPVK